MKNDVLCVSYWISRAGLEASGIKISEKYCVYRRTRQAIVLLILPTCQDQYPSTALSIIGKHILNREESYHNTYN
jgi:hypothetical protein